MAGFQGRTGTTTLVNFRNRLDEHQQSALSFPTILKALEKAGLISRQSQQRLDSTHMFGKSIRPSSKAPDTKAFCPNSKSGWSATNPLQFVFVRLWGQSPRPKARFLRHALEVGA
jgi:hypothetical protein